MTASPVLQPPCFAMIFLHSSKIFAPQFLWIAPSTPPPPKRDELAAFTMTSQWVFVMSPFIISIEPISISLQLINPNL
jgi:hypothetical protein